MVYKPTNIYNHPMAPPQHRQQRSHPRGLLHRHSRVWVSEVGGRRRRARAAEAADLGKGRKWGCLSGESEENHNFSWENHNGLCAAQPIFVFDRQAVGTVSRLLVSPIETQLLQELLVDLSSSW